VISVHAAYCVELAHDPSDAGRTVALFIDRLENRGENMNRPDRDAHTLEALDGLDFMTSGGLHALAELSGQKDLDSNPRESVARWSTPRDPAGLRSLLIWLRPLVRQLPA
jgi:hypothetical protein